MQLWDTTRVTLMRERYLQYKEIYTVGESPVMAWFWEVLDRCPFYSYNAMLCPL
jgi:hypothetical protein